MIIEIKIPKNVIYTVQASTTSTAASSTAMPTSPPVWRAGMPTAPRSSLPAAAASTPPLSRLL